MINSKRINVNANNIVFVLGVTLSDMRISMNQFSIESGIRPATVGAWCNGTAKHIDLVTLQTALNTLNRLSKDYKMDRKYNIDDIFYYKQ
ncbi:helix-turn-helix domain-containing protein [Brevibacillus sp. NRS-1366]|uniref:helix-turn-helix domain-containing protein n=1 Tax=Brevibacillus sp. NRS-1366 TaxID=3233899 RepID=UPI003D1BD98F